MCKRTSVVILLIMIASVSYAQKSLSRFYIPNDTIECGDMVRIPVIFEGSSGVCAFQFALHLPDGISLVTGTNDKFPVEPGEIFTDHELNFFLNDSTLWVACLSMTNSIFKYNDGVACYITLQTDSVLETTNKEIRLTDAEITTPDVESTTLNDVCGSLTIIASDVRPFFIFNIAQFTYNSFFETFVTVTSNIEVYSITFDITVPENLAVNNLVRLLGQLNTSQFKTSVSTIDTHTYEIVISGRNGMCINPGTTEILGINVMFDKVLIVPGNYVFSLDNIVITDINGKSYALDSLVYTLILNPTQVTTPDSDNNGSTDSYFRIDGTRISNYSRGITLIRHLDGSVTKVSVRGTE